MQAPYKLHAARPLAEASIRARLNAPLLRADSDGKGEPSLAQSLTRLQHLRRHLFRAEDWNELAWLIKEGSFFEEKRLRKHPILKIGPRRLLHEKVQHFHGRATIKVAALASAMEPPLRRVVVRAGHAEHSSDPSAPIPWNRLSSLNISSIGALSADNSARVLLQLAPTIRHLVRLVAPIDRKHHQALEHFEHFEWHTREVLAEAERPRSLTRPFLRHRIRNRLLRVALEHAQALLLHLREIHLITASGLDQKDIGGPL